jgi:hypothetical protein
MLTDAEELDDLFREAVTAIDAGHVPGLTRLLALHPRLAEERLEAPGAWLRHVVGGALDGFFRRPYLLWFTSKQKSLRERSATIFRAIAAVEVWKTCLTSSSILVHKHNQSNAHQVAAYLSAMMDI